jgi:protein TonB
MAKIFLTDWDDPTYANRNDLVFEGRNKEYGAFVIRRFYEKTINKSFLIAASAIILLVALPTIIKFFESAKDDTAKLQQEVEVNLTEPPPVDPAEPPPPPPPPPPPVVETIKFTPPVVVDKPVEEDQPPPQEKLNEVAAGVVTQEGDPNATELPPEPVVADPNEGKIFTIVEEMPQFPGGGEAALVRYLQSNIKYPAMARENGIEGIVYVTFVVDKEGKVKDAKILRGKGAGLDEEALRVVRSMPDWKPGKQNGRSVAVQYNLPVNFKLQ